MNHQPTMAGAEDSHGYLEPIVAGTGEVKGKENKVWCDLIHRGKRDDDAE